MSTTTTKPEPRTAADARREFACTSEPTRRRIRQVPGQGTIYGQASLLDCIADLPDLPAVHHAPVERPTDQDAELDRYVESLIARARDDYREAYDEMGRPLEKLWPCFGCWREFPDETLDLDTNLCPACQAAVERESTPEAPDFEVPEPPGPLHCRSCARKFAPDELDSLTGLCWACFENTAVQLHR